MPTDKETFTSLSPSQHIVLSKQSASMTPEPPETNQIEHYSPNMTNHAQKEMLDKLRAAKRSISIQDESYDELVELAQNYMPEDEDIGYFDWNGYSVTAFLQENGAYTFELLVSDFFDRFHSGESLVTANVEHLDSDESSGRWDSVREFELRQSLSNQLTPGSYNINYVSCRQRRCVAEVVISGNFDFSKAQMHSLAAMFRREGHQPQILYYHPIWSFDIYYSE
ncbi:hypothetical protein SAMN06297229_2128 [Pseudidiomarina planktonica]|uniref:Uncharacterized protein n=1 Tax=Pseudidiomarina planktonica TaxID=1323738 RepID=A0A1Y6FY54_9GAMM|nr:hypothetical protein SAMN06297229_2128 [Pseudidiomarina planktonica]